MSDLIPKGMSASDWMDSIHKITGIMPFDRKIDLPDHSERVRSAKYFAESIQAFNKRPDKQYKKMKEQVQAHISSSDLPEPITTTFQMFNDTTNYDMGYVEAFLDASSRIQNGKWEIVTSSDGAVWRLIPEGHSVRIDTKSATLVDVEVSKFGSGLAWTTEMIMRRQVGRMLDIAEDFRRGFWVDKANRHYSILANASGDLRAATLPTLEGWITDINNAAITLLDRVKNTRNLPLSHQLLIYAHPSARTKINRALGEMSQAFNGSTMRVEYNIRPIYTFNSNLPSAASGESEACLMVIPGYKLQMGEAMPVTFYNDTDILNLSFIQTAFSFYGAIAADSGTQILTFGLAG